MFAASSACAARFSMYVLLSFLTLCLTSLWALLYSAWAVAFSFLVLLQLVAHFFYFLSCTFLRVSGLIHSFCVYDFLPWVSSHVLFIMSFIWLHWSSILPCSSSIWNLFDSVMLNWSFVALSFRKLTLYFTLGFFMVNIFLNVIRIFPTSKWWSDAASAHLLTQTSWSDILNFLLMQKWSIWFSVMWSGDTHVALCMRLCAKILPPMTNLLLAQSSANLSPWCYPWD